MHAHTHTHSEFMRRVPKPGDSGHTNNLERTADLQTQNVLFFKCLAPIDFRARFPEFWEPLKNEPFLYKLLTVGSFFVPFGARSSFGKSKMTKNKACWKNKFWDSNLIWLLFHSAYIFDLGDALTPTPPYLRRSAVPKVFGKSCRAICIPMPPPLPP